MKARIWAALATVYIIWGSTYLAIRFAVETLPPLLMASTRFLAAGSILYAGMRLAGASAPTRKEWTTTGVMGLFLLLGGNGLLSWAEQSVPSGIAALLIGATPLWIAAADWVRPGGRRPALRTIVGLLLGFSGIAWLVRPEEMGGTAAGFDLWGSIAILLGSLSWAIGSIYGRERRADLPKSPLLATAMQMLVGGSALLLAGTLRGEWSGLGGSEVSARSILAVVYLILFGSIIAYSSYVWLLRSAPLSLVSTYAFVNPLVAVILGFIFAGEPLTLRVLIAAAAVLTSVLVINSAQFGGGASRLKRQPGWVGQEAKNRRERQISR